MISVKIENNWIKLATIFSEKAILTNADMYHKRNQNDTEKGKLDNRNGKIGEMVAYNFILPKCPDITYPDLEVYTAKDKSWAKDLLSAATNKKFGVKSQTIESAKKFGESWVFQNEDTGIHGTEDKLDEDNFIIFVLLDLREKIGYVRAAVKVKWLHEKDLFKSLKIGRLASKKAVYWDDLKKYKQELWQI